MPNFIPRNDFINAIDKAFDVSPIVAILGPRQCGKTTIANEYTKRFDGAYNIYAFDLGHPDHLAQLESPMITLEPLSGLIIIDEIQRIPELFPVLRVLIDRDPKGKRFLLLGSASKTLIKRSSETLAGRINYLELTPFSLPEVDHTQRLLLRGGFPHSYLAKNDEISSSWRANYISTFLEQDIPNLGIQIPARTLRRFWMMLAHYHGNIFNGSEIGKSLGIAHTTARHYLDILTGTFMIRELTPWLENIDKRQIKSPKIYFRDSGILQSLLGILDQQAFFHHPKLGSIWEGFALEEIIRFHHAKPEDVYFWGVHNQGELDLMLFKKGKRLGFEFKYADAPRLTSSMKLSLELLNLHQLDVIYPGKSNYRLHDKIRVIGLEEYLNVNQSM